MDKYTVKEDYFDDVERSRSAKCYWDTLLTLILKEKGEIARRASLGWYAGYEKLRREEKGEGREKKKGSSRGSNFGMTRKENEKKRGQMRKERMKAELERAAGNWVMWVVFLLSCLLPVLLASSASSSSPVTSVKALWSGDCAAGRIGARWARVT